MTVYASVGVLQTHGVSCICHLQIHYMSRIPFLILSVLDFIAYIFTVLIFQDIRGNMPVLKKNVAILPLSFEGVFNNWSKVGILQTPFYRHNHTIRPVLLTNLNYFKMIQKLVYYFRIKHRQLFGQKYFLNKWSTRGFHLACMTQNFSFHK